MSNDNATTVTIVWNAFEEKEIILRDPRQVVVVRYRGDCLEAEIWAPLAYDGEVPGGPCQTIQEGDYDDWIVDGYFAVARPLL